MSELGTESEPLCDRNLDEQTSRVENDRIDLPRRNSEGPRAVVAAFALSIQNSRCQNFLETYTCTRCCTSQATLPAWEPVSFSFVFSPLSESLSKSQIESIFVNFELCNAYHLFLLKDKKKVV